MGTFWKIVGIGAGLGITAGVVNRTVSKVRRTKMEDDDYEEELRMKREYKKAKKLVKNYDKRNAK